MRHSRCLVDHFFKAVELEKDIKIYGVDGNPDIKVMIKNGQVEGTGSQSPNTLGFDSMVDFSKDFVGKRALRKLSRQEPARELVGIEVPDYDAVIYGGPDCKGNEVFKDGKHIGYVTKFTYGYTVEKNIGYALVKKGSVELGDVVKVNNIYDAIITPKKHLA